MLYTRQVSQSSRFRKKCYDYETLHGVDLYHNCVKNLSGKIAQIMELIYTCISKLVILLTKDYPDRMVESLKHYADPVENGNRRLRTREDGTMNSSALQNPSDIAKSQRYIQGEEFINLAKLRNGVETIPSNIRKNYHPDKLPGGKQRGKFFFGSKIAALNFRKLLG